MVQSMMLLKEFSQMLFFRLHQTHHLDNVFHKKKIRCVMNIDEQTVRRIGRLARIEINEDQIQPYATALTQILSWVEQLNEVNTDQVEPLFSVFLNQMPERDDSVNDGNQVQAILANAPDQDLNMFAVPKVVE